MKERAEGTEDFNISVLERYGNEEMELMEDSESVMIVRLEAEKI